MEPRSADRGPLRCGRRKLFHYRPGSVSRYARDESEGKVGILDRWTRSVARLQAAEVVRYFESLAQARRMLLASNHHSRVGS